MKYSPRVASVFAGALAVVLLACQGNEDAPPTSKPGDEKPTGADTKDASVDRDDELAKKVMKSMTIDEVVAAWKEVQVSHPEDVNRSGGYIPIEDSQEKRTQATLAYWYCFALVGNLAAKTDREFRQGKISNEDVHERHRRLANLLLGLPTADVDEGLVGLAHRLSKQMIEVGTADKKWRDKHVAWSGVWNSTSIALLGSGEAPSPQDKSTIAALREDQEEYGRVVEQLAKILKDIPAMRATLTRKHGFQFMKIWDFDHPLEQ